MELFQCRPSTRSICFPASWKTFEVKTHVSSPWNFLTDILRIKPMHKHIFRRRIQANEKYKKKEKIMEILWHLTAAKRKKKKNTSKRARNSFSRDKNDDLDISFTFCSFHALSALISVFYVYVEHDLSLLIRERKEKIWHMNETREKYRLRMSFHFCLCSGNGNSSLFECNMTIRGAAMRLPCTAIIGRETENIYRSKLYFFLCENNSFEFIRICCSSGNNVQNSNRVHNPHSRVYCALNHITCFLRRSQQM